MQLNRLNVNEFIHTLFTDSLEALDPRRMIPDFLSREGLHSDKHGIDVDFESNTAVHLLATGKAALTMSEVIQRILGDRLAGGLAVTGEDTSELRIPGVDIIQSAHPVPDDRSVAAGAKAVEFVEKLPAHGILIYALSGGTSSLLCQPAGDIKTGDLAETFRLMNHSGATIWEMNTVRKHMSRIKGGQLLRYVPKDIILADLVISDVPDDDLEIIGSGPTTPDSSSFQDTYHILMEYDLWDQIPEAVHRHIEKGLTGEVPETLKPGEVALKKHHSMIIASARKLAELVAEQTRKEGFNTWVADEAYNEDVEEVASVIFEQTRSVDNDTGPVSRPAALVFYGESTVQVTGKGKGGRNQELALRAALKIQGKNITWLSAGTDGIDGPTDAAGAIVDGNTVERAQNKGLDPDQFLEQNDTYHFHEKARTLLKTGPTGNNLMDIQIILME